MSFDPRFFDNTTTVPTTTYGFTLSSVPIQQAVIGGKNITQFDSPAGQYICIGGNNMVQFDSIAGQYICIGGDPAQIFYESTALLAEAKLLYGWVKDKSGQVNDHGKQAVYLQITEL